jgi:hypothetical protein
MKKERDDVKANGCFTGPSLHITVCSPTQNVVAHLAFCPKLSRAVAQDIDDPAAGNESDVEIHRLLALAVERQERLDFHFTHSTVQKKKAPAAMAASAHTS